MTTTVPKALLAALDALKVRAMDDPAVATSVTRRDRIATVVALLKHAAADCSRDQLADLTTLLHPDTIGHPDQADTILGRAKDGRYRTNPPYGRPLSTAYQRFLMDGLADLNRCAGHAPYWWQARGMKPWTKHTKQPITAIEHAVLRHALCRPVLPRWEPYRLRNLLLVELLWATGVPPEGLAQADTTDLGDDQASITLTHNPPGRTGTVVRTHQLDANARAAVRLWLPVRREVVARHLSAGPDAAANQALFITLQATTGTYDDGRPRLVPPGLRISAAGLTASYGQWARGFNADYHGQEGWPVPTTLEQLSRGGAVSRSREPATGRRLLSPQDVADALERIGRGESKVSVAAALGVSRGTLYNALNAAGIWGSGGSSSK